MKPADEPVVTTMRDGEIVEAIPVGIVAGDPLAQCRHPQRIGVAELPLVDRPFGRLAGEPRRRRRRLADFHVDDLFAGRLAGVGLAQHVHDDEGVDGAALARGGRCRRAPIAGGIAAAVDSRFATAPVRVA